MTAFELFVIAHFIGDYLLQTEFEALNKATGKFFNRALFAHCAKYTSPFVPVFWFTGVSMAWLVLVFVSHLVFDRRWPIIAWRKYITRGSDESIKNTFWLTIMVDQIFHVLVLAFIALMTGR